MGPRRRHAIRFGEWIAAGFPIAIAIQLLLFKPIRGHLPPPHAPGTDWWAVLAAALCGALSGLLTGCLLVTIHRRSMRRDRR